MDTPRIEEKEENLVLYIYVTRLIIESEKLQDTLGFEIQMDWFLIVICPTMILLGCLIILLGYL